MLENRLVKPWWFSQAKVAALDPKGLAPTRSSGAIYPAYPYENAYIRINIRMKGAIQVVSPPFLSLDPACRRKTESNYC